MSEPHQTQAGMSLVEVIVGLAIASVLALAIGGLLTFSIQARDRLDHAARIQASLIELKVAGGLLDQSGPLDGSFRLAGDRSNPVLVFNDIEGRPPRSLTVRLQPPAPDGQALRLEDNLGRIIGPIALDAFESASLEFLAFQGSRLAWKTPAEAADTDLLGLRVVLVAQGRRWPVLLWAARLLEPT